jgi:predicted porin
MQKKIIALAIAAAFSAPAFADVTVYGQGHLSLDANSGNAAEVTTAPTSGTKNGLNATSNSSRLGFKGAEDIAGGLKSVFQLETEIAQGGNGNGPAAGAWLAQRDSYLGVAGGFGTLIAGRLPLANQYANDANFFGAKVGDVAALTRGGFGGSTVTGLGTLLAVPSRVSQAVAYVSPSLGGVTILAAYVPNTAQSLGLGQNVLNKTTSYTLRASYDSNGIFAAANIASIGGIAGVSTVTAAKDAKITVTSLAGGYDFGMAKVRAQLVSSTANDKSTTVAGVDAKQTVMTVGGAIKVSEDGTVNLQYAKAAKLKLGGTDVADTGASLIAVGYDQALSKNTTVYVAFAKVSNDKKSQFTATGYAHGGVGAPGYDTAGAACSPSALSLGLIRNF